MNTTENLFLQALCLSICRLLLHFLTYRHFPEFPLSEKALHTSRGCPVVQTPESVPSCGGTCGPGSVGVGGEHNVYLCVLRCVSHAHFSIVLVCFSFVLTTVICVSSKVSHTKLLKSRGIEQSDPTQLSEHTHTPRD